MHGEAFCVILYLEPCVPTSLVGTDRLHWRSFFVYTASAAKGRSEFEHTPHFGGFVRMVYSLYERRLLPTRLLQEAL